MRRQGVIVRSARSLANAKDQGRAGSAAEPPDERRLLLAAGAFARDVEDPRGDRGPLGKMIRFSFVPLGPESYEADMAILARGVR